MTDSAVDKIPDIVIPVIIQIKGNMGSIRALPDREGLYFHFMIRALFAYLGLYRRYIIYCLLLVTGEVVCELLMPLLMARIVDVGIPQSDIVFIAGTGGLMVVLAFLAIGLGITNMKFSAEASQGFAANLRRALFDKIQSFSFTNIDSFRSASLVTRLTTDVNQLQITLLMSLRMLLRAPLMLICALFFVIGINAPLSVIIFFAMAMLVLGIWLVLRPAEKLFAVVQQRLDVLNGTIQENLTAIRVVKVFVREAQEKLKFAQANDDLMQAALKAGYLTSLILPVMIFVLNLTTITVIWFSGQMVVAGTMGVGALISFLSYLMLVLMSVMIFSMMLILFARARACVERILEVLQTEATITDKPHLSAPRPEPVVNQGLVEFRHVDFRYAIGEGKNVLSDITFTAAPGQIVAIIGGTGSGKTSLLNLIPRLYDVTGGRVVLDGVDVRDYRLEKLRETIGMVLQQNVLFSGTIRDNLLWGNKNATQAEIEDCAHDAQAHDFILDFPAGYDTRLGQGGVNISGGQKQRLCIARALLKKPSILILDDSTSAIDTATEARIQRAFRRNHRQTTVLIVSQRINSVKDADNIIVLEDGRITGIGKHATLRDNNTIYREICLSQQEGLVA
jgi:ATP-binding cassette, subfamily B, multidrug efflux pump